MIYAFYAGGLSLHSASSRLTEALEAPLPDLTRKKLKDLGLDVQFLKGLFEISWQQESTSIFLHAALKNEKEVMGVILPYLKERAKMPFVSWRSTFARKQIDTSRARDSRKRFTSVKLENHHPFYVREHELSRLALVQSNQIQSGSIVLYKGLYYSVNRFYPGGRVSLIGIFQKANFSVEASELIPVEIDRDYAYEFNREKIESQEEEKSFVLIHKKTDKFLGLDNEKRFVLRDSPFFFTHCPKYYYEGDKKVLFDRGDFK